MYAREFLWKASKLNKNLRAHFAEANHNGDGNWEVRVIDQTSDVDRLREKESFLAKRVRYFSGEWIRWWLWSGSFMMFILNPTFFCNFDQQHLSKQMSLVRTSILLWRKNAFYVALCFIFLINWFIYYLHIFILTFCFLFYDYFAYFYYSLLIFWLCQ